MISQAAIKTMMIDILNKEEQFLYRLQDDSLEYIIQNVFKCGEMPKKRTDFAFKERFSTYFLEYLEKTGQLQELKDCRENSIDESKKQKIQLKLNIKQAIEESEKKPPNIQSIAPKNIIVLSDSEDQLPALPVANGQVQTPNLVIKDNIFDFSQIVQLEKQENNFNGERPPSSKVQPIINKLPTESLKKQDKKKQTKQSKIPLKKDKHKQNISNKEENKQDSKGRRQSLDQVRKEVQKLGLLDTQNKKTQLDKPDKDVEKEKLKLKSKSKTQEIEKKSDKDKDKDKDKEKTPSLETRNTLQVVDQLKSTNIINNHLNINNNIHNNINNNTNHNTNNNNINNNTNTKNNINQWPPLSTNVKQTISLGGQPRAIDIIQNLNKVSLTEKPLEKPLTTPQIATPSCTMKKNNQQFFNQPIIEKNSKKNSKNEKESGKQQKDLETSKIISNLESPSQNKQINCHYCKYNVFQQTIAIDGENRICCSCFLDRINPFSLNVKNLGVLEYTFQNKNQFKFTQDFQIDEKYSEKVGLNIEIRCIQMSKSALSDITFPNSCSIHIDNMLIKEFKPLLDKSCLKKRKDQSIIIPLSEFMKTYGKRSKHNLTITEILPDPKMRTDSKDPYYFGIYLIESITPKQLLNHIMSSNEEKLQQLNPQNEVKIDKTKASLICQFSLELIQVPARGIYCQHFQCFSLNNYLEMQYKTEHRRWTCPVCKKVSFNLIIDKYQQKILNKIILLELNIDFVMLDQDGLMDKDDPLNLIVYNDDIQTYQQLTDRGYNLPRKQPYIEEDDDEEMPKIVGKQESTAIIID